jgi:hypothetical protein
MKKNKISLTPFTSLDNLAKVFEIIIAGILLVIIAVKIVDTVLPLFGINITILVIDFESILAAVFNLVIGIEFTKMLVKHTPETIIDVLLFTIARQIVISNKGAVDMLIGVAAIVGIFAAKRYLLDNRNRKKTDDKANDET